MTEEKIREIVNNEIRRAISKSRFSPEQITKALLAVMSENRELSVGLIEELAALMFPGPSVYGNGFNRAVDISIRKTQTCMDKLLDELDRRNNGDISFLRMAQDKLKSDDRANRDEGIRMIVYQIECLKNNELIKIIKRRIGGINYE
jgi:hypothetical protein